MRKKTVILWCICLLVCVTTSAIQGLEITKSETIKVGYVPNYTTILEPIKKGHEGYGYEYLMEVAKYTGWEYEFIPCTWKEGISWLESGEIDLFGPEGKSEEKEKRFAFPTYDFGASNAVVLASTDSDIGYGDVAAFEGRQVGVIADSIYIQYYEAYIKKYGVASEYVYIEETQEEQGLATGLYDLRVTNGQYLLPNSKVVAKLGALPIYYIARKGNTEIVEQLDWALEQIYNDNFLFSTQLYEKYYGDRKYAIPVLTKEEKETFREHGVVRVGYGVAYPPMQYTDSKGEAAGVCIDLFNLIAAQAGLIVEYVPIPVNTVYSSEEIDLSLTFTNMECASGFTRESAPYIERTMMMIGRPFVEVGEVDNRIGMIDYEYIEQEHIQSILPSYSLKNYESLDQLKEALTKKQISHLLATAITIDTLVTEFGTADYSIYSVNEKLPFKIHFSDALPDSFLSGIDKQIESIDADKRDAIYLENIKQISNSMTFKKLVKKYIGWFVLIGFVLVWSIIMSIWWALRQKRRAMLRIINTDHITGLYSQYKFTQEAEKLLQVAQPNQYMLVSIDMDNFKFINELYGYESGTDMLRYVAQKLQDTLTEGSLVTRIVADEFVVFTQAIPFDVLVADVEKKSGEKALKQKKDVYQMHEFVHMSMGVYYIDDPTKTLASMLDFAGIARKSKKEHFGHTIAVYTEHMEQQRNTSNKIVSQMQRALDQGEFVAYLQPKICLETGDVMGAEVLVRWKTADGIISPAEFIPVFERNGFITQLDLYMFEKACELIQQLDAKEMHYITFLSVNISRFTLLHLDIVDRLTSILARYKLPAKRLELEITESAFTADKKVLLETIEGLREVGFGVAIDDFGTEYSSLASLYDIPAEVIKLDKGFVDTVTNEKGQSFLSSAIHMLKKLKNTIVAEGIEEQEQVDLLKSFKCDIGQGYYFARPMDVEQFFAYCNSQMEKEGGACE